MNKDRRSQIDEAMGMLHDALALIENLASEEQESFDNMPEGLQQSERGVASEEAANDLSEAVDNINGTIETLENAKGE